MPHSIFTRLISRGVQRTEADIQADVRALLLLPELHLEDENVRVVNLETQVGDRRRIDIEIGSAAIEIKKDLRRGRVRSDAVIQLAGYVAERTRSTGTRYVGILTDGVEWNCYDLSGDALRLVSTIDASAQGVDVDRLIVWLEGVLATAQHIPATAAEISVRLGAGSSAHALDRGTVAALYEANRHLPTVRVKRGLWSKLLTSTLGNQFEDSDELFVEHTLLVNSAEIIAHSVLGLNIADIEPQDILSGTAFTRSSIYGVVEQDFFDWPLEVEGGPEFVRALARRLARFDWVAVEQDVLKTLYESVITPETRKRLGEYYTPDWLAQLVVNEVIQEPLGVRALDPACGSGTFLFHAVRKYLDAARDAGMTVRDMLAGVSNAVFGMDLHPVAVTLARVGNPPWLAYRHMPVELQEAFKVMEDERGLWAGEKNATHQDLSALFVARVVELYLESGGRFGLVMPNAVADREHYAGFRRGSFVSPTSRTLVQFESTWDLRRIRPHFFPRGASVIFGTRDSSTSRAMPVEAMIFSGSIGRRSSLADVEPLLQISPGQLTLSTGAESPYAPRFRQGASFVPRFCYFVERIPAGPLGFAAGQTGIKSSRSSNEKLPWKALPSLEGVVEDEFLWPLYSGETLLPYRSSEPLLCALPHDGQRMIPEVDELSAYPGYQSWWQRSSEIWEANKSSDRMSLFSRLD